MITENFKKTISYNFAKANGILVDKNNSQDNGNTIYYSDSLGYLGQLRTNKISEMVQETGSGGILGCTFSIGSGTTATESDYALSSAIDDTDFSIISASYSNMHYTQVWQYNGTGSVTINEIGLFAIMRTTWNYYRPYLMAHQILDSPITVDNGDAFTVSMAIG